ncbi:MAG: hypothetical protein DI539_22670 [Flavobacterium psychrophilum]|nr:MAG: hypothetical protein DI539_22670 [Flavobacterium psychrophilum]
MTTVRIKSIPPLAPGNDYSAMLDYTFFINRENVPYKENYLFIDSGKVKEDTSTYFISVVRTEYPKLLNELIPILTKKEVRFIFVRSKEGVIKTQDGDFGRENIGKLITIFLSEQQLTDISSTLQSILKEYHGPKIPDYLELSNCFYTRQDSKLIENLFPHRKVVNLDKTPAIPKVSNVEIIRTHSKGNVLRGRYRKNIFSSTPCIIKYGHPHMWHDEHGRDIMDRIRWQSKISEELAGKIPIPKLIFQTTIDKLSIIATEEIKGVTLIRLTESLNKNTSTIKNWDIKSKQAMVEALIKVVEIGILYKNFDYVNLDLMPENFIIDVHGKVFNFDLELVYSTINRRPNPPFPGGSPGFMSLNQINNGTPEVTDMIYAVGATILFSTSGIYPNSLIFDTCENFKLRLNYLYGKNCVLNQTIFDSIYQPNSQSITFEKIKENLYFFKQNQNGDANESEEDDFVLQGIEEMIQGGVKYITSEIDEIKPGSNPFLIASNVKYPNTQGLLSGKLGLIHLLSIYNADNPEPQYIKDRLEHVFKTASLYYRDNFHSTEMSFNEGLFGYAFVLMNFRELSCSEFTTEDWDLLNSLEKAIRETRLSFVKTNNESQATIDILSILKSNFIGNAFEIIANKNEAAVRNFLDLNWKDELQISTNTLAKMLELFPNENRMAQVSRIGVNLKYLIQNLNRYKERCIRIAKENGIVSHKCPDLLNRILIIESTLALCHYQEECIIEPSYSANLLKIIPEKIVLNNLSRMGGISSVGEMLIRINSIKSLEIEKRLKHITRLLKLFQRTNDSGTYWISPTLQNTGNSLSAGNAGILHYLMALIQKPVEKKGYHLLI